MKIAHPPMPPMAQGQPHGGAQVQGKTAPAGAAPAGTVTPPVDPSFEATLSDAAQQAVQSGVPAPPPGNSANSPAHLAKSYVGEYPELGEGPFGQLVKQIAHGTFTPPNPASPGDTDPATGDAPADVVADEPDVVVDEPDAVPGDEGADDGDTTVSGADEGEATVTETDDGETTVSGGDDAGAAGDEPVSDEVTDVTLGLPPVVDDGALEEALIEEFTGDDEETS